MLQAESDTKTEFSQKLNTNPSFFLFFVLLGSAKIRRNYIDFGANSKTWQYLRLEIYMSKEKES